MWSLCNDSLAASARDTPGRNDAATPAATSLSPSRRLIRPSELPAGAIAISISFIQVSQVGRRRRAVSGTAGAPRCDLLDQPGIAVGISEGKERPVTGVLGVGAGKTCLKGGRRAVPHLTRPDTTTHELVMGRLDVGDNERPHG